MRSTITGKNNDRAYPGAMKPVAQALQEIAWIAELSKADAPPDEAGLRRLMNKMALGARKARSLLENVLAASARSEKAPGLIPVHGGYRKLKSFQVAEVVYDGTAIFCDRFINKRSRTHDQMVQGARSGRQNTAEGSMASATSKKTEIKLTNVAKASLEELLLDYQDFLRQRHAPMG